MKTNSQVAVPEYTDGLGAVFPPRLPNVEDRRVILASELLKRWGLEPLREHGGGVHGCVTFALDLAAEFYKEVERREWEAGSAS